MRGGGETARRLGCVWMRWEGDEKMKISTKEASRTAHERGVPNKEPLVTGVVVGWSTSPACRSAPRT